MQGLLGKLLSQLQASMCTQQCPFPHVVRAGAIFVPIHLVKERLFPRLPPASVDHVLQEHRVELRPTTLWEAGPAGVPCTAAPRHALAAGAAPAARHLQTCWACSGETASCQLMAHGAIPRCRAVWAAGVGCESGHRWGLAKFLGLWEGLHPGTGEGRGWLSGGAPSFFTPSVNEHLHSLLCQPLSMSACQLLCPQGNLAFPPRSLLPHFLRCAFSIFGASFCRLLFLGL